MSVIRLVTASAEITYTYSNSKALRPWTCATHDTHGTPVFQNLMYRLMYIFASAARAPSEAGDDHRQVMRIDQLGDMDLKARQQGVALVFLSGERRQRHGREIAGAVTGGAR